MNIQTRYDIGQEVHWTTGLSLIPVKVYAIQLSAKPDQTMDITYICGARKGGTVQISESNLQAPMLEQDS